MSMSLTLKPDTILHRKITWLLLFSVVSMLLASWVLYSAKRNLDTVTTSINRTYDTIQRLQDSALKIARTSPLPMAAGTLSRLDSAVRHEKALLAARKSIYGTVSSRIVNGLVVARIATFLAVAVILVLLNKDISHRKRIQESLVLAIREAEAAKRLQQQFLANMSHEIRTPMNGIKGMTDLLLGTPLTAKQKELAGIIKSSAGNLLVVINDILDFSKIQAGKLTIERINFSVSRVVNEAVAIFDHRAKKKGLKFTADIAPDVPNWLVGDPHRLNQVLLNLIGNAIKFTDQGAIHLQVEIRQHSANGVTLNFSVEDTGIGIPPDSLPRIFDSFSQAGHDTTRLYGGTGLGLTICKQLLQLQDGEIAVTSTVGKGSVFSFHLPYKLGREEKSSHETSRDYSTLLKGKRFLVAEDNEINQKLIDYVLKKAGGTVEIFSNGAEAVRHLQQDPVFDLIIMDLQMPEMDGYAATRYIRNNLHLDTPIIAMTATAMKGEQIQCIESGMNEYMTKPFEFSDLYSRISRLLS